MKTRQKIRREDALKYHSEGRPGKIEVVPTKPYSSQQDLSLAYSPGVAQPCLEIAENPDDAYKYTDKGNLVAVISNGTAVLGLGDIGAVAGKPVMEGKGLLFKIFADIDVFDIEVDTKDVDKFIETVKNISPTFGGINLEDIKAPECFEIEERLRDELSIPVMHDDQHGTAIISAAAMLNAFELTGRKIEDARVVVNGAGAAAVSCSKLYIKLGIKPENLVMCDSRGVISTQRTDLSNTKKMFATSRAITTLAEALVDADLFLGLSVADVLSTAMVQSMAKDPIVFALANPNPEIDYDMAKASREDLLFATGRSDYSNQVNNVLGFPYIFRGALDVRATTINEEMKVAAVYALAELAKEPVPEIVLSAYNDQNIKFGRDYLIPKALDPRLISVISMAVAKAAIASRVARKEISNWDQYAEQLEARMGRGNKLLQTIRTKVYTSPLRRIAFAAGEKPKVLAAAYHLMSEKLAHPILIGDKTKIEKTAQENGIDLGTMTIVDFRSEDETERRECYASKLYAKLNRSGMSFNESVEKMTERDWFTLMMVDSGDADTCILTYSHRYTTSLEPVRQVFASDVDQTLASMVVVSTKKGPLFFADIAINSSPSVEQLVDIAKMSAASVRAFGVEPVIAMLSNSNFGTDVEPEAIRVASAVRELHKQEPDLLVDGEMKADIALDRKSRMKYYPFSKLGDKKVNTFIFPNIAAANITYKMIERIGDVEVTGPILLGLPAGVHLIAEGQSTRSLINLAMIAVALK